MGLRDNIKEKKGNGSFRLIQARHNEVPYMSREVQMRENLRKEAQLKAAMSTEVGLRKIAANLANPVREKLDYVGLSRKFNIVEQWPEGMPIVYDKDIREWTGVQVGKGGSVRFIEIMAERITLTEFEVVSMPMIPYSELYTRLYQVVTRAKQRLEQAISKKEDLLFYAALDTAATAVNSITNVSTYLTKDALARSYTPIELNRLPVANVLMTAAGIQGIRRWQMQDIDEVSREEIARTGYKGRLWGSAFYVTDQLAPNIYYNMTLPELVAWMPFRKELEVIPNDEPKMLLLGFVGYEMYSQILHNALGVSKGSFNSAA